MVTESQMRAALESHQELKPHMKGTKITFMEHEGNPWAVVHFTPQQRTKPGLTKLKELVKTALAEHNASVDDSRNLGVLVFFPAKEEIQKGKGPVPHD